MSTAPVTIPAITYKVKPYKVYQDDSLTTFRLAITYKVDLTRTDCNLRPHEHTYYNSDLFVGMLRRAARDLQQGRTWQYLDSLPDGITVDTSKFLAVVTLALPTEFMR